MCVFPGAGVWITSTSNPSGASLLRRYSSTAAVLPGGLTVFRRTRSRSMVTTSESACAVRASAPTVSADAPAASAAIEASIETERWREWYIRPSQDASAPYLPPRAAHRSGASQKGTPARLQLTCARYGEDHHLVWPSQGS